jgi:hypothetical protein
MAAGSAIACRSTPAATPHATPASVLGETATTAAATGTTLDDAVDPMGFEAGAPTRLPHPAVEALSAGNELITPIRYEAVVHRWAVDSRLAITATVVTLSSASGALATFNGWIATFGFMPAIERSALDLGDQAEALELGWPSLHQVIARDGDRFVLVEADAGIPAETRSAALRGIAERTMATRFP